MYFTIVPSHHRVWVDGTITRCPVRWQWRNGATVRWQCRWCDETMKRWRWYDTKRCSIAPSLSCNNQVVVLGARSFVAPGENIVSSSSNHRAIIIAPSRHCSIDPTFDAWCNGTIVNCVALSGSHINRPLKRVLKHVRVVDRHALGHVQSVPTSSSKRYSQHANSWQSVFDYYIVHIVGSKSRTITCKYQYSFVYIPCSYFYVYLL